MTDIFDGFDTFWSEDDYYEENCWITATGEAIPFVELGQGHLINCILMIERRLRATHGSLWEEEAAEDRSLRPLLNEAMRRQLPLPHMFGRP